MSDKKKVLIVTQEMKPYLIESTIAKVARELPQYVQENGMEIRVLMPRFGVINERRHRLHEVVRLSGINIIIEEDDFPLIIKVASLPGARMQVYFLDNEEFFKRKFVFQDKDENFYTDNAERMVFFCKGVLETVKKFGWPPDVIHCHGWMTSLIPLYVKTAYADNPLFENTKVVYSAYENAFDKPLSDNFNAKARINKIDPSKLDAYGNADNTNLHLGAMTYSDGIIRGDEELHEDVLKAMENLQDSEEQNVLEFIDSLESKDYLASYKAFYQELIGEEETEDAA